jgi:hypothetical protein
MISKDKSVLLRSKLFRHLDGIVITPTAYSLKKHGITDYLLLNKKADLAALAAKFNANEGYLNVALRGLCSQGWLNQEVDNQKNTVTFEINETSKIAFNHFFLYEEATTLLQLSVNYHPKKFMTGPFLKLESMYKKLKKNFGIELSENKLERTIQEQIFTHIEGIIVGPTIVHLGISGLLHK